MAAGHAGPDVRAMTPTGGLHVAHQLAWILLATLLLVGGALAAGSGLVGLTAVVPPVPPVPSQAAEFMTPTPTASSSAAPASSPGVVAYELQGDMLPGPLRRIWLVNADGSGAHELLPDVPGDQEILGWSPDGSRLLYMMPRGEGVPADVYATDATSSVPELICAADAGQCPDGGSPYVRGPVTPRTDRLRWLLTRSQPASPGRYAPCQAAQRSSSGGSSIVSIPRSSPRLMAGPPRGGSCSRSRRHAPTTLGR